MSSRIVQLIARKIALVMVAVAVWLVPDLPEDQQAQIADFAGMIAAGLVAFAGLVVDLLIHKLNNGGILAAPKNAGRVSPALARKLPLWAILALAPALIQMPGCSGTGAGQAAREGLLAPAVVAAWPSVRADADRGILAELEAGEIGPGVAEEKRERVRQFDAAVARLGGAS